VAVNKLDNYLLMYRRRAGLTQKELAFLLGWNASSTVSRHERRECVPLLPIALAYEAVLKAPVSELFAGISQGVEQRTRERAQLLSGRNLTNGSRLDVPIDESIPSERRMLAEKRKQRCLAF